MENKKLLDLKGKKWVIGVSGGADSMALLDMCRRSGIFVIAAHMNYKKRETANRDMNGVIAYCEQYHIPCYVKILTKTADKNFQSFAREERYAFYSELLHKYKAKGVLIGHHLDDHLETYIMQKNRRSIPEYYGIKEETYIMGCLIKRVLLNYTKEELRTYCDTNHVPYYDDESNFTRAYTRNRIRIDNINAMNREEKGKMCRKIQSDNVRLSMLREEAVSFYETWDKTIQKFLMLDQKLQTCILDHMIYEECHEHVSMKELLSIIKQMKEANNWTRVITSDYYICNSYGSLSIHPQIKEGYCYVINKLEIMETPYFKVATKGSSTEAVTVFEDDFPLRIRNVKESDVIQLRFGRKKVHRWFIDRKIPVYERKLWPVVENAKGDVILVPKIGCDIAHFSNNPVMFVIK